VLELVLRNDPDDGPVIENAVFEDERVRRQFRLDLFQIDGVCFLGFEDEGERLEGSCTLRILERLLDAMAVDEVADQASESLLKPGKVGAPIFLAQARLASGERARFLGAQHFESCLEIGFRFIVLSEGNSRLGTLRVELAECVARSCLLAKTESPQRGQTLRRACAPD
jgi:hypothetical protein